MTSLHLNTFARGQFLFKSGNLTQSKQIFQTIIKQSYLLSSQNLKYSSLINLSTIQLQLNKLQPAESALIKAIHLNPLRYEAYYNLSLICFYKNTKKSLHSAVECIKRCLSILYLQNAIIQQDLKQINKSISLWKQNPKAYIHKAILYKKQNKLKLAQNQLERLIFQFDQQGKLTKQMLTEIYAQKVILYRQLNKPNQMEQNLKLYLKSKNYLAATKVMTTSVGQKNYLQFLNCTQQNQQNQTILKTKITQNMQQVHKLLMKQTQRKNNHNQNDNILIQDNNQQQKDSIDYFLSNQNNIPSKIIEKPSQQELQQNNVQNLSIQNNDINAQLKQALPQDHKNYSQQLENYSISLNEDQDSAILNQKIQQLQREIKQSGGNVPDIKDMSKNSDQQNFLQFQIEKTIQEINNKKKQEEKQRKINNTKSPLKKSNQKNQIQQNQLHEKSGQNDNQIKRNQTKRDSTTSVTSDDKHDTMTIRSRLTQTYELNLEQIKNYKSFKLQIRSLTMFDQKSPKKQAYVKIIYFYQQFLTEKSKNDKLTWNQTLEEQQIKHSQDQNNYQINIQVHAKQGGWLSWHSDILLGTGVIKLTQKGQTKCTLEHKDKKVGMLYYKLKLIKKQ